MLHRTLALFTLWKRIALCPIVARYAQLEGYLYDGHLEIDNNFMENAIRPVAISPKNWLLAGSHAAAENIAMNRSFFATCHINGINPYHWPRAVLEFVNSNAPRKHHTPVPHLIDLRAEA